MIIQVERDLPADKAQELRAALSQLGLSATSVTTQCGTYLVAIGKAEVDIRRVGQLAGVRDVHRVTDTYKLVSRKWKVGETCIDLGGGARNGSIGNTGTENGEIENRGVKIGNGAFCLMAGPCSIEDARQVDGCIEFLKQRGVRIMRGGAFKPRSSPYTFRGLGLDGLKMWYERAHAAGILVISEVMAADQIDQMYPYIDIFQVGTRNTQNFSLLHELGRVDKPVLLKRGMSGTLEELLQSAEYIWANGNEKIILCERGIRTFERAYRNSLDLNAVPLLKEKSHLPVVVDPSHGIGIRRHVETMALAAVMAGADGLLIEIHEQPEKALSDGDQSLNFEEAAALCERVELVKNLRAQCRVGG